MDPDAVIDHEAPTPVYAQLAAILRDRLEPSLKVFIEYSNEVWNGAFDQSGWVSSKASAEGITWYAWYARRAVQIFDMFVQGQAPLRRVSGGLGIGLSLSRKIAELHGGTAGVASAPGRGSTFYVWLPLAEANTSTSRTSGSNPTAR